MLNIRESSRLLRWAYLFDSNKAPWGGKTIDLCSLFWRIILCTPGLICVLIVFGLMVVGAALTVTFWMPGVFWYQSETFLDKALTLFYIGAISLGWLGVLDFIRTEGMYVDGATNTLENVGGVIEHYIRAKKDRWCPLIRVK